MNFTSVFFVVFCVGLHVWVTCGFAVVQNESTETELTAETQSCFPDTCKFLEEFGAMKVKQEAMEARLRDSEKQILELKSKEATQVAFSAAANERKAVGPFTYDTVLTYRAVITNVGNAYNKFTGIFTAPVPGIYFFTFFYHAGGEQRVHLALVKNNHIIVTTSDHKASHDTADNGANAVFLQLQQGDQVHVRMWAHTHIWGDESTTFSGYLLRQI